MTRHGAANLTPIPWANPPFHPGNESAYHPLMTKLLDKALEAVRRLSSEDQDEIARAMLALVGEEGEPDDIDPAHVQDVLESLAQTRQRKFAGDAGLEAAFRRFER
jgi:hypothetical protein